MGMHNPYDFPQLGTKPSGIAVALSLEWWHGGIPLVLTDEKYWSKMGIFPK